MHFLFRQFPFKTIAPRCKVVNLNYHHWSTVLLNCLQSCRSCLQWRKEDTNRKYSRLTKMVWGVFVRQWGYRGSLCTKYSNKPLPLKWQEQSGQGYSVHNKLYETNNPWNGKQRRHNVLLFHSLCCSQSCPEMARSFTLMQSSPCEKVCMSNMKTMKNI